MVTPSCKHLQCIESFLFVAGFWPGVLLCPVLSKHFLKFFFDSAFLQLLQKYFAPMFVNLFATYMNAYIETISA